MWVMISLVIFSLLLIASARTDARKAVAASGAAIGQQMLDINKALGSYSTNATVLTALRASPMGTVPGVANLLSPTVDELKSFSGLDSAFSATPFNGGSFMTSIVLMPAGCTGFNCSAATRLWMTNPLIEVGGKLDIGRIGSAITVIGGNGGYSVPNNSAVVSGGSGWVLTNPDTALPARAGILMAINGAGSLLDSNYVRMNDARDPNLQGNLTVAKQIVLAGTGTEGGSCAPVGAVIRNVTTNLLLMCDGTKWVSSTGSPSNVTAGSACANIGQRGTDVNGLDYMCRGGVWVPTKSLLPYSVEMARYLVQDASVVPFPSCAAGGTLAYNLIPIAASGDLAASPPFQATTYAATGGSSSWVIAIYMTSSAGVNATGNNAGLTARFSSLCVYPA